VLEAGVVGAEEGGGLVKPYGFVVPRDAVGGLERLRGELRTMVEARLAPHQRPRDILVVEELPRTATGKLQRFKLREQVAALQGPPRW
jgi:benzoate-CoA ligase